MTRSAPAALLLALLALSPCTAAPPDFFNGWRGNGTGLWPDAHPPLEWSRVPQGVMSDLRSSADRPDDKTVGDAPRLPNGLVRDWLVLGPFAVKDSVRDFNEAQLADEAAAKPAAGDKVGDLAWKPLAARLDDRWEFGSPALPRLNLADAVGGFKPNQVAYAHAYLHSPKGGRVRAVVEHAHGLKAWLNGKELYNSAERGGAMGSYYSLSRVEFGQMDAADSPSFELDLKPGWNRLLLKVSTYNKDNTGWTQQEFCLRLMDLPNVAYESKNVLWMAELPHRSNATPIVVGDRIFVMAEPDELLCLDKKTGKVLWTAANNYYEALTSEERAANPAFKDKIDPLLADLKKEGDFKKRLNLRNRIQKTLSDIDFDRFAWKADDHFREHFGIVGFTTPTPVSDGKRVWVWCGNGVAACYDLDGTRRWITRVEAKDLSYASSPALADGTLAVFLHKLVGLDADSGKLRWEQPKININNGAILGAKIAGVPVFVSQRGHVVRASDGKLLHREANPSGDTGWAPPVVLGDVVYQPNYGVNNLNVLDYTGAEGDEWKPKSTTIEVPTGPIPDGKRVDRWTAGSPLVVDGVAYLVDIYGTFYAVDLEAKKLLYRQDTELRGLFHYNALPVAASPTLVGKQIVIQDNQGTALVLQPGREFKQVGKNRLGTQLDRYWPVPAQETVGYAPPVPDGDRLYVRGERFLYCIGAK
jgi:outer membrane protein assembly factor BamB